MPMTSAEFHDFLVAADLTDAAAGQVFGVSARTIRRMATVWGTVPDDVATLAHAIIQQRQQRPD